MKNVLSVEFFKLRRMKSFYILMILSLTLSSLIAIMETKKSLETGLLSGVNPNNTLFLAIFTIMTLLIVNIDISNGTLKNIIGAGVSKRYVYFARIIVTFVVSMFLLIVYTLGAVVVNVVMGGVGEFDIQHILVMTSMSVVKIFALNMLFVFIGTIITSEGLSILAGLIVGFALPVVSASILASNAGSVAEEIAKYELSMSSAMYIQSGFTDTPSLIRFLVFNAIMIVVGLSGLIYFKKQDIS